MSPGFCFYIVFTHTHTSMCIYMHVHVYACTSREYIVSVLSYNDFVSVHVYLYIFLWILGFLLFCFFCYYRKCCISCYMCVHMWCVCVLDTDHQFVIHIARILLVSLLIQIWLWFMLFFLCVVLNWPPRIINIVSYKVYICSFVFNI